MLDQAEFKSLIENDVIKDSKKIKGKKLAIAEIVKNTQVTLAVKSIYNLNNKIKHFYLIKVKSNAKQPKFRYFIAISLANTSSDLLVQFARKSAITNNLQLIQYSIHPKTLRIQLLSMKEIRNIKDYKDSIETLKRVRNEFREKLVSLRNLVENE
jgi:hypothetical protein